MPKNKWILVADDDPDDIELLQSAILSLAPTARVKTFPDGKSILLFLSETEHETMPCTIVLDYNMPQLNGPQVLREISKNPVYDSIPKLVWSTSDAPEHVNNCLRSGAADYLVKPGSDLGLKHIAKKIIGHCIAFAPGNTSF